MKATLTVFCFLFTVHYNETNVSAKEKETRSGARLFGSYCHQKWSPSSDAPPKKGSRAALCLMARAARLTRADFPSRAAKVRVVNDLFSVSLWEARNGGPKLSCVVSKKIATRAVDRNFLKRQCREIASPLVAAFKKPVAVVVYPKKAALAVSFSQRRTALVSLLGKLDV